MEQIHAKRKQNVFTLLLVGIFLLLIVSMAPAIIPEAESEAHAEIEYEFVIWGYASEQWEAYFMCKNCEQYFMGYVNDPDDAEGLLSEFEDWELNTPYCHDCWEGHLCGECHEEPESPARFCEDCSLCIEHWDDSIHCHQCGGCVEDLCQDCLDAEGWHICTGCHTELAACPGCGVCMYPLYHYGDVDMDHGDPHCVFCDEEWICNECGECFFNYQENFCGECEMCIACAVATGLHCRYCDDCFGDATGCEGNEGVCLDCCIDLGNHCEYCEEHVTNWCSGGKECGHCHDCASSQGWLCDRCGNCEECDGFSRCDTCGDCDDCCQARADARGCVCLVYCVEDSSFEDEEHRCQSCHNFLCEVERCDDCGLCIECCMANSEAEGCECGICIESGEFEDHLCENCGLPFCTQGDPCDDCGLCQECCLDASASEGCSCGLCVESDEFFDADHLCEQCEQNFSCNVNFCDECGLCEECCAQNAWDEYECDHGVCIESNEWDDHYCDVCGKCKEDCSCGEECCADPYNDPTDLHGSPVPIGSITKQPTNRTRTVSKNIKTERADNLVTFSIRAYDPKGNVTYQWYVVRGDEEPVALVDESEYIVSHDETLVFVGGAKTNKLIISVPCDACLVSYSYYCTVTTTLLDTYTSESASLIGKHNYGYVWTSANGHSHGCVGCGYIDSSTERKHEIGPWQYAHYATATEGALVVRECRVCGGIAESYTTEPLGDHPYHTYVCQPVYKTDNSGNYVTDDNGEYVSVYHEKRCLCGRKSGQDEEHVWSAWVITKAADEKRTGSKYHDCAVCNYRETVTIKKQTHDHVVCFDIDESPTGLKSTTGYDSKYHWAKCVYLGCSAFGMKEEHQYDEWHIKDIPYNRETETDRLVWRSCKVCGYTETKEIKSGSKALVFTNATARAQAVDNWQGDFSVHTATAKPPKGYYFDHWEVVVDGDFTAEELFDFDQFYWKKTKRSDGSVTTTRVYTTIYDETVAFKLIHHWDDSYNIVYHLKAVCYRYENQLLVYPNADKDDCCYLGEGDTIATNYDPDALGVAPEDSVVWVESVVEDQYGWVIYYDGADKGPRTMTVHLNGYRGGSLEVTSFEQNSTDGLPCNLHIIVDKDSVIRTNGSGAIWGCPFGGDVIISSTTGATLSVHVNGINPYTGEVYGIHTDKAKIGFSDKVSFQGNVNVEVYVTNQGGGYSQNSIAYGIYSESQVEVFDDASLKVEAISWDHGDDSKGTTAYGIFAKKELRTDTTSDVEIVVRGVRSDCEKKGQGVKTKYIYVDNVNHFYIDYNTNVKSPYNSKPQYDAKTYISYVRPMYDDKRGEEYNRCVIEPGHKVTLNIEEKDGVPTAIIDVQRWYTDEEGYYLVRDGEDLYFTVTPAPGYYDPIVLKKGGISISPYGLIDGVTEKYVVCDVDGDFTLNIYGGTEFQPYASQPGVSQKNVYYDSEARLSYRLKATDAIYYHSLLGGEKSNDPKFKKEMGEYGFEAEVITTNFTIDRVFLQRYDSVSNRYKNTGIDFAVSAVSEVTFKDSTKYIGQTVRYRLMIVFDGAEYSSESFSVTWTENQEDVPEPVVDKVELHVAHAGSNDFEGGKFDGGDARILLDSDHPYYYYTVATGLSYAGSSLDLFHAQKRGENPVTIAEFNYHTGTLTFNGTSYAVDFNGDGWIKTEDGERGNIHGEILGIRVSDESAEGGLIIDVAGNTTISGDYEKYGWSGGRQYYGAEAVINNEYGFVRIKSSIHAELNLVHCSKAHDIEGILTAGDVYVEGDVELNVTLGASEGITVSANADRYGIYAQNVILRGDVVYRYTGVVENRSKCLKGESVAVYAEEGKLTMLGNAYAIIYSGAAYKDSHDDYNAVYVVELNIVQNASMYIEATGDVNVPVYAETNVLIATTGIVRTLSLANDGGACAFNVGGTVELRNPSTFLLETEYNGPIVKDGEDEKFVTVGTYTYYKKPGFDKYFPGDNHMVSVIIADDMEYYFSRYDYEIAEPDTTVLTTGFHYMEYTQNVRVGDTVTYLAAEAKHGFSFEGWEIVCAVSLPDLTYRSDDREITFTMPDYDVALYPIYKCTAFDERPVYYVIRERESKHATLYWSIDANKTLRSARLEKLGADGEWVALDLPLTPTDEIPWISGMTTYRGEQALKVTGASGEGMEIPSIGTYRIHAVTNDGYFADYNLYSEAFVIDFEGGVHLFAEDDAFDPTIVIPKGYVGTEYVLYLSDYIYSDDDLEYEFQFGALREAVENGVIGFTLNGRVATFKRNAPLTVEGEINTRIVVTDPKSGHVFYIPFGFGSILGSTAYPLVVGGRKVYEYIADDILGDGTVSYDAEKRTLTLNNAKLDRMYAETSDGATKGGYAILCVEDIIIELIGDNIIDVGPDSVCVNDPDFDGTVIAIGNVTTEAWRALVTGINYSTIAFTGSGSLTINVSGQNSHAVYGYGQVNVDGAKIVIRSEGYGVTVEGGGFAIGADSAADVSIDCLTKSAVWIQYSAKNFYMFDGKLRIDGGADDYAVRVAKSDNMIDVMKEEAVISTKSETYDLTNGYFSYDGYLKCYNSDDGETYDEGAADKTAKSVKLSRNIFIWVNGERITPEHLSVVCGTGTATYDPETRTLTLKNATITKGLVYYHGTYKVAGIYTEEPLNVECIGSNKIDLTSLDLYDINGEKVELDSEDKQYLPIYGIQMGVVVLGPHGYEEEDRVLTVYGDKCYIIGKANNTQGFYSGLEVNGSVVVQGVDLTMKNVILGISTSNGLHLQAGNVRIETTDDEYAYAVYGDIAFGEKLAEVCTIFGNNGGDFVRLTLADLVAEYGDDWGQDIRSLWIRDFEVDAGTTIYHEWNAPTYVWSEDGTKVTAKRVCKNDPTHVETETVGVKGEVTKGATCTEDGETTYTSNSFANPAFSVQTRTLKDVPALGHDIVHHDAKAATCTEIGWNAYDACTRCDYTTYAEIAALGHDIVHHDAKAATCTEKGWLSYDACTRCAYTTYAEIPALGHDVVHHDAKAATCTEIGWNAYDACSRCDYTTYAETAALGHDIAHHDGKAATCTKIGWNAYDACTRCAYTTYAEIAALGHDIAHHDAKAATCTEIGWNAYDACSRCDYTTYAEIPALGHDVVHHDGKAATCTEIGWNAYDACTRCDYTTYAEIAALGHTYGEWEQTKAPQVGAKGEETRTCSVCGATEKRDVAAIPYVPVTAEDGSKVYNESVTSEPKDVTELFTQAKEEEGMVEITVGDVVIAFDSGAVNAIGGAEVTLSARVLTESAEIESAEMVLEVTLSGATFEGGSATVSIPFEREIPADKVPKVYYIDDDGNRTDMNASFADGKVTFTTNHFSTYAVVFEDPTEEPSANGLPIGAIVGIAIAAVALLVALGAIVFFLSKRKQPKKPQQAKRK